MSATLIEHPETAAKAAARRSLVLAPVDWNTYSVGWLGRGKTGAERTGFSEAKT